jgi:response regulator of citrate/malate metabolism
MSFLLPAKGARRVARVSRHDHNPPMLGWRCIAFNTMSVGWQVLIVDADANAVAMHRAAVAATARLQVAAVVPNAADAIPWLAGRRCDLLLLELQLPEQDGLALLRCLREHDNPIEVIAATSTSESHAVRACAHCGVVDYLVKPFSRMRLQQAR